VRANSVGFDGRSAISQVLAPSRQTLSEHGETDDGGPPWSPRSTVLFSGSAALALWVAIAFALWGLTV
jgi:hypothetical protein